MQKKKKISQFKLQRPAEQTKVAFIVPQTVVNLNLLSVPFRQVEFPPVINVISMDDFSSLFAFVSVETIVSPLFLPPPQAVLESFAPHNDVVLQIFVFLSVALRRFY